MSCRHDTIVVCTRSAFLGNRSMRVFTGDALEGKMLVAFVEADYLMKNNMEERNLYLFLSHGVDDKYLCRSFFSDKLRIVIYCTLIHFVTNKDELR